MHYRQFIVQPRGRIWVPTALAVLLALGSSCSKDKPPLFVDVPPADELYEKGLELLEGKRVYFLFPTVDYEQAIETFQTIIDNYPYHELAVKSELRIADA